MEELSLLAPAKVNLVLRVGARGPSGYHAVETVMATLVFGDELRVRGAERFSLTCTGEGAKSIPREENLAARAALALATALEREPNVALELEKRIPAEAGLGGGSSDAAAVLRALSALWGVRVDDPRVASVARELGSDVPFFLGPRVALLSGRGDEFVRALPCPELPVVLVRPQGPGVSTPACYRAFDELGGVEACTEPLAAALEAGDPRAIGAALANDLEAAAFSLKSELGDVLSWLGSRDGVTGALLAGSGSACFALAESNAAAARIATAARSEGLWALATSIMPN